MALFVEGSHIPGGLYKEDTSRDLFLVVSILTHSNSDDLLL